MIFHICQALVDIVIWYLLLVGDDKYPMNLVELCAIWPVHHNYKKEYYLTPILMREVNISWNWLKSCKLVRLFRKNFLRSNIRIWWKWSKVVRKWVSCHGWSHSPTILTPKRTWQHFLVSTIWGAWLVSTLQEWPSLHILWWGWVGLRVGGNI